MQLSQLSSSEYLPFYQTYINYLPDEELISILEKYKSEFLTFLKGLSQEDLKKSYAENKWTVAEVLQHLLDTERIFQYRALTIARGDKTQIPGYDQNAYVPSSTANRRDLDSFIEEFAMVRNAGIALYKSFDNTMLERTGIVSGAKFSTRAAGFITAGHQKHHLGLFKSRYGL